METILKWLDRLFDKIYTSKFNPFYQSGRLAVLALTIVTITGVYLLYFYKISDPYNSVARLQEQWWGGRWIRTLHRYASDMTMIFIAVHALRMFVEKKATGPRVLAWTSGVVLVLLVFICGWTGLVMVWDQQGQLLALVGARLFDALPIFSEPIQRSFLSGDKLPDSFFFLNLFLHVAVPLGVLLLLLVHVWRLATAHFFPTKGAIIGCSATFVVFSMLMPVALREPADLSLLIGRVHIDWFYSFWAPSAMTMVPALHLSLWLLAIGVLVTAPWWWRAKNSNDHDKGPPT